MAIKIIFNKYNKKNLDFVANNPEYETIDWYGNERQVAEFFQLSIRKPISTFPSVVDTNKKMLICGVKTMQEALDYFSKHSDNILNEKKLKIRAIRDAKLSLTDKYLLDDFPLGSITKDQIKIYRQSLRNITKQPGFPENITWPTNPFEV